MGVAYQFEMSQILKNEREDNIIWLRENIIPN